MIHCQAWSGQVGGSMGNDRGVEGAASASLLCCHASTMILTLMSHRRRDGLRQADISDSLGLPLVLTPEPIVKPVSEQGHEQVQIYRPEGTHATNPA